jgi:hypothetical protein
MLNGKLPLATIYKSIDQCLGRNVIQTFHRFPDTEVFGFPNPDPVQNQAPPFSKKKTIVDIY